MRTVTTGGCAAAELVLLVLLASGCCADQGDHCYSSGGVAGIVVATAVVTAVLIGLGLGAAWYFLRRKNKGLGLEGLGSAPTRPQSATGSGGGDGGKYAYDNPYFRDEESSVDVVDKGRQPNALTSAEQPAAAFPKINGAAKASRMSWAGKAAPLSGVFSSTKKHRTMDDSCLQMEPERIHVPLRGHDFTGLGFNICGNMRDGIFVKDVLNRGPANESGLIKPGDRIASVTVSFGNMVYEDALTILSYASPYDVRLELVKPSEKSNGFPSLTGSGKSLASRNSGKSQRLFHPLYRSQSIDDLTQIGKEGSAVAANASQPKRSQSIGVPTQLLKTKNLDSIASDGFGSPKNPRAASSTTGSLNEKVFTSAMQENLQTKAVDLSDQTADQTASSDNAESAGSCVTDSMSMSPPDSMLEENTPKVQKIKTSDDVVKSPKRAGGTPGKRKAPAPPVPSNNSIKTTAEVHHQSTKVSASLENASSSSSFSSSDEEKVPPKSDLPHYGSGEAPEKHPSEDVARVSFISEAYDLPIAILDVNQNSISVKSEAVLVDVPESEDPEESPTRRKASSLGDLTAIEDVSKKSTGPLERAVSLDFQNTVVPGENLGHQKMVMKKGKDYTSFKEANEAELTRGLLLEEESSCSDSDEGKPTMLSDPPEEPPEPAPASGVSESYLDPPTVKSESFIEVAPPLKDEVDSDEPSPTVFVRETVVLEMKPKLSNISSSDDTVTTITPSFEFTRRVLSPDFTIDIDSKDGQSPLTTKLRPSSRNSSSSSLSSADDKEGPPAVNVLTSTPAQRIITVESFVVPSPRPQSDTSRNGKEVIEISKHELDKVMLSHKDFLLKKAHETGMYGGLSKDDFEDDSKDIEFESWHYTDDGKREPLNGTNGSRKSDAFSSAASYSQYKTALEGTASMLSEEPIMPQKVVDKSGFHMKTVEGPLTTTVIISTSDNVGEPRVQVQATEMADSPPPELFPPL